MATFNFSVKNANSEKWIEVLNYMPPARFEVDDQTRIPVQDLGGGKSVVEIYKRRDAGDWVPHKGGRHVVTKNQVVEVDDSDL